MAAPTSSDAESRYEEYEAALASLLKIPAQLRSGLANADKAAGHAKQAADGAFEQSTTRIAGLRRTADSRYSSTVDSLKAHNVLLPARVRPEVASSGDEDAIRRAVDAHNRVAAAVEAAITATALPAAQERQDAASRVRAAQQAALALKLRQERVREEQRVARNAAAKAQSEAEAQRRKRVLIISSVVAAGVVAVAVVVIFLFVTQ
ncbi:hypothetical protein [Microbacterium sp. NPDC086615]|uniref:hypothetical protein n=1 Tax=Microbacterium sp. NPDC086615 TaxID=3154865 RepID=UPI003436F1F5